MHDIVERPKSVTVIAWILIVWYGFGFMWWSYIMLPHVRSYFRWLLENFHLMIAVVLGPTVCGLGMVSGIAMLKGRNWGRILYLCSIPVFALYSHFSGWLFYGSPSRSIPDYNLYQFILRLESIIPLVIPYIVVLVFLTRTTASSFFAGRTLNELEPEE